MPALMAEVERGAVQLRRSNKAQEEISAQLTKLQKDHSRVQVQANVVAELKKQVRLATLRAEGLESQVAAAEHEQRAARLEEELKRARTEAMEAKGEAAAAWELAAAAAATEQRLSMARANAAERVADMERQVAATRVEADERVAAMERQVAATREEADERVAAMERQVAATREEADERIAEAEEAAREIAREVASTMREAAKPGSWGDRPAMPSVVSLGELRKATGDFAEGCTVGSGGFGTVYRTMTPLESLPGSGLVAVKLRNADSSQGETELLRELQLLGTCAHPHLMPLLAFCVDPAGQSLVYPLMVGGNFEDRLLVSNEGQQRLGKLGFAARPSPLPWIVRLRALRDVMDALVYLHTPSDRKSVELHHDIKPSNILLDAQVRFGLDSCLSLAWSVVARGDGPWLLVLSIALAAPAAHRSARSTHLQRHGAQLLADCATRSAATAQCVPRRRRPRRARRWAREGSHARLSALRSRHHRLHRPTPLRHTARVDRHRWLCARPCSSPSHPRTHPTATHHRPPGPPLLTVSSLLCLAILTALRGLSLASILR